MTSDPIRWRVTNQSIGSSLSSSLHWECPVSHSLEWSGGMFSVFLCDWKTFVEEFPVERAARSFILRSILEGFKVEHIDKWTYNGSPVLRYWIYKPRGERNEILHGRVPKM